MKGWGAGSADNKARNRGRKKEASIMEKNESREVDGGVKKM